MIFDAGLFDGDLIEDYLPHYTLDTILEELKKPASYELDAVIGDIQSKLYHLDAIVRKPYMFYSLDAVVVMDKRDPRFVESIINAILISHGRVLEELSSAIALMELRLQLPYATGDDLNLYWSKVLALRRRYGECDEDYRRRLIVRLSIMRSSGTKPECESILNNILGMKDAVDLQTYWPAQVRVSWKSYTALRRAEERYGLIAETMNQMLAAGVSWSTAFPYKIYDLDAYLAGTHAQPYRLDAGISRPKWALYLLRADIFIRGNFLEDLDVIIATEHSAQMWLASNIVAFNQTADRLDANISEPHRIPYQVEAVLRSRTSKSYPVDGIAEKGVPHAYDVDGLIQRGRVGMYLMAVEVVA